MTAKVVSKQKGETYSLGIRRNFSDTPVNHGIMNKLSVIWILLEYQDRCLSTFVIS